MWLKKAAVLGMAGRKIFLAAGFSGFAPRPHGGEGRTKLHVLRYETRDYLVLAAYAVVLAGVLALAHFGL